MNPKLTMALVATSLMLPGTAFAETIRLTIASSHSTSLPWVGPLHTRVVAEANDRLETLGSPHRIDWTEAYSGALYGFSDTLDAVTLGITDIGWVGTLWEESRMPYQNVTLYTPFVTDDPRLLANVFDTLHTELPFMREAWEEYDLVYLGGSIADTYHLITTFPVNSIDDLRGRRILTPGATSAYLSAVGAVPVSGALTTYYNQIETGVADGVLVIMTGLYPLRLYEVAPHVTLVGAGANFIGGMAANRDSWEALPEDVQGVLRELGQAYTEENVTQLETRYAEILAALEADPDVTVSTLSEAERQRWVAAMPDIAGDWASHVEHGRELLDAYMAAAITAGASAVHDWSE